MIRHIKTKCNFCKTIFRLKSNDILEIIGNIYENPELLKEVNK